MRRLVHVPLRILLEMVPITGTAFSDRGAPSGTERHTEGHPLLVPAAHRPDQCARREPVTARGVAMCSRNAASRYGAWPQRLTERARSGVQPERKWGWTPRFPE